MQEVSKVVNLDWINHKACSLLQNIYVITDLFITNNHFLEMIRKIIFTNYFSEFIRKIAIKFRFRKTLQKKCFQSVPVPGRLTVWITVGQRPTALAVGAVGRCLNIFALIYLSPFSPKGRRPDID